MEDTQTTPASFLFVACAFNFYEAVRDRLAMPGLRCDFLNDKDETPFLVAVKHYSSCEVILELLNEEFPNPSLSHPASLKSNPISACKPE
jgi:hypothetical protein